MQHPQHSREPRERPVRSAAIVGLHWGLVHLRGLREAGCDVVALASSDPQRARETADREGVPRATADVAELNDVDLVVVAVPAAAHVPVLALLPRPWLICEKPLVGLHGPVADLPPAAGRMLVNYAFAFLGTARTAQSWLREAGPADRAELEVSVALPQDLTAAEWFLEAASHPLSWLLHQFGPPTRVGRAVGPDRVEVQLRSGEVPLRVILRVGGEPGIHHRVRIDTGSGPLQISGRYRPGGSWQYDPVLVGGSPRNRGEWSETDCWLDANAAAVTAMVDVFRGRSTWEEGLGRGLFDADKALMLERVIRADLSD